MWNLDVHNLVQSSPKFITILSQIIHSMPFYLTSLRQIVILSSHLCVYFPSGLLPGFLLKYNTSSSSLSFRPHALPIICSLTHSTLQYLVWIKNHESPCYLVFLISCYFIHPRPRYVPRYPVIKHPQHMSFGNVKDGVFTYMKQQAKL